MKKVMTRLVVLFIVAMGATTQVQAQAYKAALYNEDNGVVRLVAQKDGTSFDLVYNVPTERFVKVNILNDANRVVFTEVVRNRETFRRPYNLNKLPEGTYTFEVKGLNGTYTQRVEID